MKKLLLIGLLILIGVAFSATVNINSIAQEKLEMETWKHQKKDSTYKWEHHRSDKFRGERHRKGHKDMRKHMMKMHENIKQVLSEEEIIKFDSLASGMKALWKERKELHEEMQALRQEMREMMEPHKDEIKKIMKEKFDK